MPRWVALLRGVSPMNARMPQLREAYEAAGFTGVKTVLASGNVVFDSRSGAEAAVHKKAAAAMEAGLPQSFPLILRKQEDLAALLERDPFARFKLAPGAKKVVSFLAAEPEALLQLPLEKDGARILALEGRELYSAYVVGDKGPVFMQLIERTFGKNITTRTWDTVRKCAAA